MLSPRCALSGFVVVFAAACGDGSSERATKLDAGAGGGASVPSTGGYVDPALANGEAAPVPSRQGFQYSGSVALLGSGLPLTVNAPSSTPDASAEVWVELSAPVLPKVDVLYTGQGTNYPATPQAQAKLAHDSALTFETLLSECQPLYPEIVLRRAGDAPLTDAQVSTNFRQLELCAYERYLAKPYWIPQLIHDVDICRQELGPGWRMLTEADLPALSPAATQNVQETLAGVQNSSAHPESLYFSLKVWVLLGDGSVGAAQLQPDAAPVVTSLQTFDLRSHYEGRLTLRCLRVTQL